LLYVSVNYALNFRYALNNKKENNNTNSAGKTAISKNSSPDSPTIDSIDKAKANTIASAKDDINKAMVSLKDSLLWKSSGKFRDYRFFGYSKPDIHSKKNWIELEK
jgi:hypothetical protein